MREPYFHLIIFYEPTACVVRWLLLATAAIVSSLNSFFGAGIVALVFSRLADRLVTRSQQRYQRRRQVCRLASGSTACASRFM
jgi:hypothetical protein